MPQTDFILREIEKIGAMLRMLIRRRVEQKDTRDEEQLVEQTIAELYKETQLDMQEILQLEKKDFANHFVLNKGFNLENIELLADLLYHFSQVSDYSQKNSYSKKAIEIYEYINETSKTYSIDRDKKINILKGNKASFNF
jgi:hypothetical protein